MIKAVHCGIIFTMQKARVFILERHPATNRLLNETLEDYGHTVVGEASSFDDFFKAVASGDYSGADIDAGIINSDLGGFANQGEDANRAARLFRELWPNAPIIGIEVTLKVEDVEDNIKIMEIAQKLGQFMAELPDKPANVT